MLSKGAQEMNKLAQIAEEILDEGYNEVNPQQITVEQLKGYFEAEDDVTLADLDYVNELLSDGETLSHAIDALFDAKFNS
jgi:hypothetical protein